MHKWNGTLAAHYLQNNTSNNLIQRPVKWQKCATNNQAIHRQRRRHTYTAAPKTSIHKHNCDQAIQNQARLQVSIKWTGEKRVDNLVTDTAIQKYTKDQVACTACPHDQYSLESCRRSNTSLYIIEADLPLNLQQRNTLHRFPVGGRDHVSFCRFVDDQHWDTTTTWAQQNNNIKWHFSRWNAGWRRKFIN